LRAIRAEKVRSASFEVADLRGVYEFAAANSETLNIYIGVASRATSTGRDITACRMLSALFAEIDFKDSSETEARARLDAFPLKPSAVVFSGGGLHVYFFLRESVDLTEQKGVWFAGVVLKALAKVLGADMKAAEPARILRLPGTLNHKYTPPRQVVIEKLSQHLRYDLKTLAGVLPWQEADDASEQKCGVSSPAQPLPEVVDDGSRNNTLFREGCRLRRLGWSESEIYDAISTINQSRCHPPLPVREVASIAKGCAGYESAKDTFPSTETGDAEFFVACHSDTVRFDHRRGRWLLYDGHIWVPQSNGEIARLALESLRARQRAAVGNEKRMAWAIGGEKRARQVSLLAIAQNLLPIADAGDRWDLDPWLVGAPNGVIDLQTGSLRPGRPEDRITMRVRVPFDPHAVCPLFLDTIQAIFGEDGELLTYVHRALGYSLTGDCREEVFFLLWGVGANGKSTLIGIVTFVFGDYADDLPFSALERSRFGGGIPNDIAKLVGRRCVTASESNDVRLNEARIKALTGRDPITARLLHQEFFTFEPVAKFWLTTNTKPEVRDDSEGFWRRVHLIPFIQSFLGREDKKLKDKLRGEASGILTWLVHGCLAWQRDGLQPPEAVINATAEYRKESQQLPQFFESCCLIQADATVQAGDLYKAYLAWCRTEQQPADLNQRTFGEAIRRKFEVKSGKAVIYLGIGLLDGNLF
jgi:putative DNA primase/helicase